MSNRWLVCFETRSGRRTPIELWGAERIFLGPDAEHVIANARRMGFTGRLVAIKCDANGRAVGAA